MMDHLITLRRMRKMTMLYRYIIKFAEERNCLRTKDQ